MVEDGISNLPPPRSGLFLEVSFRRLLNSCHEIMKGDTKLRSDLKDWRTSPVFHHYVETLQEQLLDLGSSSTRRLDPEVLSAYKQIVETIANQLCTPNVPSYVIPLAKDKRAVSSVPTAVAPKAQDRGPNVPTSGEYVRVRDDNQHAPLSGRDAETRSLGTKTKARNDAPRLQDLSSQATDSVLRHRNMQENLTDQLVPMAAALRRNAQAMEQAVSERGALLEDADTVLDGNVAAAGRAVKESKVVYKSNKRGFCWTLMVLFFTGITFLGVYLFIKATRFAGYKRIPVPTTQALSHEEL